VVDTLPVVPVVPVVPVDPVDPVPVVDVPVTGVTDGLAPNELEVEGVAPSEGLKLGVVVAPVHGP